ncbi:MAG: hypothetical protein PWQ18_1151 [Clostridia bacterium]|nr:hypothetical protein [Clostridia bacterium]
MEPRLILYFLGGLIFCVALVAGLVRPWRGLVLIWASGVIFGMTGLVPGLTPPYVASATILGSAALAAGERATRRWFGRYGEATRAGVQILLGALTALLVGGIFLGPLWGLALAGGAGGLAAVQLTRLHSLPEAATALWRPGLRLGALLIPAALLGGRLLGLF